MSNFAKLEFAPLTITGSNYVPWSVDVKNHLRSMSLIETLDENEISSESNNALALVFIRRHIDESLRNEHLTVENPSELWKNLKDRYDHWKEVLLPKYRNEWNNLRFQDFKKVSDYNSVMFHISSYLKYCEELITEEQMIEKTLSTFHASNIVLQQQYRAQGFKKYSKLITTLMVAEEYNELLIKNHQSRPTGSKAFIETNYVKYDRSKPVNNFQGRGRGHQRGGGRARGQARGRGGYVHNQYHKTTNPHYKRNQDELNQHGPNKRKIGFSDSSHSNANASTCHRCGATGHWIKTCRTPEHLVKLYTESINGKGKGKEANFIDHPSNDYTHFGSSDFHNDFSDIGGNYTDGKEVNYIDRDAINEFTQFEESDFYHSLMGDAVEPENDDS